VLPHPPLDRRSVRTVRRLLISAESNDFAGLCVPMRRGIYQYLNQIDYEEVQETQETLALADGYR